LQVAEFSTDMTFRVCIIVLLLLFPALASPQGTHSALCDMFFPAFLDVEEWNDLREESWSRFSQDPMLPALWEGLEGLDSVPPTERWTRLDKMPAAQRLALRRRYLGWLYSGDRGWRWGRVKPPLDIRQTPPQPQDLPTQDLSIQDQTIKGSQDFDYLVVGSGPAGSVLGHQLSEAGFRVLLVEKGSFVIPDEIDTRVYPELKVGDGAVPTEDGSILVRNGQTVGGGSTVNIDLAFAPTLPFVRSRFEGWRSAGLIPDDQWTPVEVEAAYQWVVRTIGTRTPEPEEVNANNDILKRGALAVGLEPAFYDLNTLPGMGVANDKLSATRQLLLPAMTRDENALTVLPDFDVRRLEMSGDHVVAVEGQFLPSWTNPAVWQNPNGLDYEVGATYQIRARNVVLAAGTQGSACILLRSGVGGGTVGKGIVLHPSMPFIGLFADEINPHQGTPSTVYSVDPEGMIYECTTGSPQYVALMLNGTGPEIGKRVQLYRNLGGFGVLLVDEPVASNRIEVNEAGDPEVFYHLSAEEKRRLARGVLKAVNMMLAAGAEEVYIPSSEIRLGDTRPGHLVALKNGKEAREAVSDLQFTPGASVLTSAHMQSSCKLGTTPANSVVDADLKVWGVDNLYICDSSVFPTSVGANPMQTIYTLAKMTADRLSKRPASGSR
jgi:choline dehydrogenase-like flavoprotein